MTDRPTPEPPDPAELPAETNPADPSDSVDGPASDLPPGPGPGSNEWSGSRWEQDAAPPVFASVSPVAPSPPAGAEPAPIASRSGPTPWARRIGLAGAAAALVAVGGAGGFALAHATSDEGDRFEPASFTFDRDGDGGRGFDDHGFGGGGSDDHGFDDHGFDDDSSNT